MFCSKFFDCCIRWFIIQPCDIYMPTSGNFCIHKILLLEFRFPFTFVTFLKQLGSPCEHKFWVFTSAQNWITYQLKSKLFFV
jgi:hypothetical protein